MTMLTLAAATVLIPFVCALLIIVSPRKADKALCIGGAAIASLGTLLVAALFSTSCSTR